MANEERLPDDPDDFAEVLERLLPSVQAFVRLRMGAAVSARESSSDVIQSVCRELLEDRESSFEFRGEEALRAWLHTAALRKIMQKARHHNASRRAVDREIAFDADPALAATYASCVTPSRNASAREQVVEFERAFWKLGPTDQQIITMIKVARLSHAEAAKHLGRTPEAARSLLRRALVRLAALLRPE